MARTPAQRGKIGNWLVERRMARGWETQEKARGEIERLTGWRIPQSVYAEWESGRRVPSDANLERLEAFYGEGPTATSPDDLADAIRELADAIRQERAERLEWERGVVESLQALGQALAQRGDPSPETPANAQT